MFPYIVMFGKERSTYDLCFALALLTIPVLFYALRKKFEFSGKRTFFYVIFTLSFGLLSARLTSLIRDYFMELASNGAYEASEKLRNYGIPMFLPLFFLIYCLLFRDRFKDLMDYLAPGVYSVMTFVKLGCVLNGCCRGAPDPHGIMNVKAGYRTFPVQLYDMLTSIAIVVICIVLIYTLRKKHKGLIYPIGGILFALTKGFWEGFREHPEPWEKDFFDTGWTFWQFWMLILLVGCVFWLIMAIVWNRKGIPDFDEMSNLKFPQIKLLQKEKQPVIHHKKKK